MWRTKRILVPVDFSANAREALSEAIDISIVQQAHLDLVHVFDPPDFPALYGAGALRLFGKIPDLQEAARSSLDTWAEEVKHTYSDIEPHFREGHAATEIIAAARELESDLIVLSTHGLTGLKHALMGSVAEQVVRAAPCAVLVVRASDRAADAAGEGGSEQETPGREASNNETAVLP